MLLNLFLILVLDPGSRFWFSILILDSDSWLPILDFTLWFLILILDSKSWFMYLILILFILDCAWCSFAPMLFLCTFYIYQWYTMSCRLHQVGCGVQQPNSPFPGMGGMNQPPPYGGMMSPQHHIQAPPVMDEDSVKCSCGFSAVVNRKLSYRSGLFYEDEMEITG